MIGPQTDGWWSGQVLEGKRVLANVEWDALIPNGEMSFVEQRAGTGKGVLWSDLNGISWERPISNRVMTNGPTS